ncbi:MAG: AtpZ/AtpI family protein [Oscillospiraceae bacterium]|nr:AtpZ/AtpI family protein [Oscillospiraceae bacterium]
MLTPTAIWIGFGLLLSRRWGVGNWTLILCILIGVISGCYSMFRFLLTSARMIDPIAEDKKEDNSHESH